LHKQGYRLVNIPTLLRENPPPLELPVPFNSCHQPALPHRPPEAGVAQDALGGPWSWRAMLHGP
jgi:hypothetical protein